MDKLIIVFYVGVGDMPDKEIPDFIEKVQKRYVTQNNEDREYIFIPERSEVSRVECINPKYITNKELIKDHEEKLALMNKYLEEQIKEVQYNFILNDGKQTENDDGSKRD